jgi:hypothetical protein
MNTMNRAWALLAMVCCTCTSTARDSTQSISLAGQVVATRTTHVVGSPATQVTLQTRFEGGGPSSRVEMNFDAARTLREVHHRRASVEVDLRDHGVTTKDHDDTLRVVHLPPTRVLTVDALLHVGRIPAGQAVLVDLAARDAMMVSVDHLPGGLRLMDLSGVEVVRTNGESSWLGPGAFAGGDAPPQRGESVLQPWPTNEPMDVALMGVPAMTRLALDGPGQRVLSQQPWRIRFDPLARDWHPTNPADAPWLEMEDDLPLLHAFASAAPKNWRDDVLELLPKVHAKLVASPREPPSVRGMLTSGGDCDGAALLLAASLRVRGHSARPVVGYVLRKQTWHPHAWTEVWSPDEGWVAVDATGPVVSPQGTHLRMFVGVGSQLTMGRVLGVVRFMAVAPETR